MASRKQKIEDLIENFHSLRRTMIFHAGAGVKIPRITPSQWGVLMFIEQKGKSTVKDVANAMGITSSAATQLVDGLVLSRYITREASTEDRRTVILALSAKVKAQVEKMKKEGLQKFIKLFEALSDKELDQYILLNKKIVERIFKK